MSDKKQKEPMTAGSFIASVIVTGLIVGLLLLITNCARQNTEEDIRQYHNNVLNKNPDQWTQEDEEYIKDYIEWELENN